MSNIMIAGAGHGGLVAGAMLAKAGHNVTVYEKLAKKDLGHDWQDRFTFSLLAEELGIAESDFPEDILEYRGDCAFVSPAKRKRVVINYSEENRQKIMWRKPLINMLIENAEKSGVKFRFETPVLAPITECRTVKGVKTKEISVFADLVIDAAGIFSPLRTNLPKHFLIENTPKYGDVFYAYRAYYNKTLNLTLEAPFEVYLRHEGEPGLSWFYTADQWVDILIGRTYPLTREKVNEQLMLFREDHPWFGDEILHGGQFGVIPVRRPLTLMVADGYAAIGDSAFMTTPMNGMGIDLSIEAGRLLADTVFHAESDRYTAEILWEYNRDFHMLFGADTAKNEGLKNALLTLPSYGVDFLFEQDVIQSSDLSGAGRNTNIAALLGKLTRGMKRPPFFGAIINGLIHGSKAAKLYASPPLFYDLNKINDWNKRIRALDIAIDSQ